MFPTWNELDLRPKPRDVVFDVQAALMEFVQRNFKQLVQVALVLLRPYGNFADAEDAVQDFIMQKTKHIRSGYKPAKGPLSVYARTSFVNFIRTKNRSVRGNSDRAVPLNHCHVFTEDKILMRLMLSQASKTLTAIEFATCGLYFDEDLSYAEIADRLHIKEGAVGVRLLRARVKMQNYMLHTNRDESAKNSETKRPEEV
jgi:RNA polymerase sigma factor (sigma-70 family)